MNTVRVFPRRTEGTPDDPLAIVGEPPKILFPDDPILKADEIHISTTFTYDKKHAEYLAYQWEVLGKPVKLGGPAYDDITTDFVPGMYLKDGFILSSVGCPNGCWFCKVWQRVGGLIELEIKDGWILQDDNILACSEQHIKAVFEMLKRQKHKAELRGGLEAKLLKPWHVELLQDLNPQSMFFAYDTPDDYTPLVEAGKMLIDAGFNLKKRKNYAYVLMGYPNDTFEKAEKRCIDTLKAGFIPFGMLYKDDEGKEEHNWRAFQRQWTRPAIIVSRNKDFFK